MRLAIAMLLLTPIAALSRGWHDDLPLDPTNEIINIYFTNLVEALWERQDAAGVTRQEIVYDYIDITSTNSEVVTNTFGARSVVSTNYTLVLGTNAVTNVLHQTPQSVIMANVETGIVDTIASYLPPWWHTNGTFNSWLQATNGSGAYPQSWHPFEVDFSEPANYLERTGRGMHVFQPSTNDWGRVTTGDGYFTRTYTNEPIDVILWQGWLTSYDGGATRFAGASNAAGDSDGDSIQRLDGVAVGIVDFDLGTNQCVFTYRYGGTNTLGSITAYATGTVWSLKSGDIEPGFVATGITYALSNQITSVTDRWVRVTDVDYVSGTVPNLGTTDNQIIDADSLTIGYSGIMPHYGGGAVGVGWDSGEQDPLVSYQDINEFYWVLDSMQIVQDASGGWTYDFNFTNSLAKTGTSGTSNTWASAQAGATSAWNAASTSTSDVFRLYNTGQLDGPPAPTGYVAQIITEFPTVHLKAPATYTGQYDYVPRVYLRVEEPQVTGYDDQGTGYIEDLFWTTDSDFDIAATNATSILIGPIPSNTLFTTPNWDSAPTGSPVVDEFGMEQTLPLTANRLSMTLDFGTPTGGFTYVSDIVYSNIYQ